MLHLVIGNKNYSSWSLRRWLAMKVAGIAFQETVISLEAADFKARVQAISGAGKVPSGRRSLAARGCGARARACDLFRNACRLSAAAAAIADEYVATRAPAAA